MGSPAIRGPPSVTGGAEAEDDTGRRSRAQPLHGSGHRRWGLEDVWVASFICKAPLTGECHRVMEGWVPTVQRPRGSCASAWCPEDVTLLAICPRPAAACACWELRSWSR